MRTVFNTLLAFFLLFTCIPSEAQLQDSLRSDWFLMDPEQDHVQGVSAERVYATLLKQRPSRTIIVAVIDSGIDIDHEDLKDVLWTNEDEIAGNSIDDDNNGYIDDVYGWNFIGGKDGNNVNADTYEVTREYARLKPLYENMEAGKVPKKQKAEYEYWLGVKKKFDNDYNHNKAQYDEANQQYELYTNAYKTIHFSDSLLKHHLEAPITKQTLQSYTPANDTLRFAKETLLSILNNIGEEVDTDELVGEIKFYLGYMEEMVDHFSVAVESGYNLELNTREIVGDNQKNLYEKTYGNNNVTGPDPSHGTHVAGIIGANRKNDIGIKGIADNVKIMSVRAVPNGDERDKDVANAIIYAVDNGAQIINMSFGKDFSPQKEAVDKAVRYAASKNVLLIHAAGNDADDNDAKEQYPSRFYLDKKQAPNWIEVAASAWGADENFVAEFTNYGKSSVDLFAPGVEIYSTTPGNQYENNSGTSMASPATAGVAAIIMSYFPELSAVQVKEIVEQSTRKFDNLKITKPGTDEEVKFSELSRTGGLVNAYEAVKLALSLETKLKK